MYRRLKKLHNIIINDRFTSYLVTNNKSSRFKGRAIIVHQKGVTKGSPVTH